MTLWLNVVLLLAGAAMMGVALYRALSYAHRIGERGIRRAWRLLSLLIAVFLVGYGGTLLLVVTGRDQAVAAMTSAIFAAGALFVLLTFSLTVISLLPHLSSTI